MSFEVVLCHFCGDPAEISVWLSPFGILRHWAVPTFMIISFMLTYKHIYTGNIDWFGKRMKRLLIPQIIWPFLYFGAFKVHDYFLASQWIDGPESIFIQVATGAYDYLCPQMWFQTVLIVLTILFFGIFFIFNKRRGEYILITLTIVLMVTYYCGYHDMFFIKTPAVVQRSYGNVSIMLPYAIIGCYLYAQRIKWWPIKHYLAIGGIVFSFIIYKLDPIVHFTVDPSTYAGIALICYVVTFFFCIMCIPFEKMGIKMKKVLIYVSKYTMGIYCIHYGVGKIMPAILHNLNIWPNFFVTCIIDYIVSLIIAIVISKIPIKICRYLVL